MVKFLKNKWLVIFVISVFCSGIAAFAMLRGISAAAEKDNGEINSHEFFKIRVVDSKTGRGIPLVELKTSYEAAYYTDSAGYIAFHEPGLFNRNVFFAVKSHGYSYPDKVDGVAGVVLKPVPGGEAVIKMDRINIAERLYRLTGMGIYRDSVLLGLDTPLKNPVLNARVTGQDSTHAIVYNGKIYWFWGDTAWPEHPLGNFRTTGATSLLPGQGGLDPDKGVDYSYFTRDDGFTREMVPKLPKDPNLCWIGALMTAVDNNGKERLLAGYSSVQGLTDPDARGVLIFNDETGTFSERVEFDVKHPWKYPTGAATLYEDNGKQYWLFARPWPVVRVLANFDSITDQKQYEAYTCIKDGRGYNGRNTVLDRDESGNLIWSWKKNAPPLTQEEELKLYQYGLIKKEEMRFQLWDIDTGKRIQNHASSVRWNEYRKKWSMIFTEMWGTSLLGEVWYAEADSPTGPWYWTKKIVTHENYSFYNPIRHDFFDGENGRFLYFEGTYTSSFATDDIITPRYEYNQVMYRLDLEDPRLTELLNARIPGEEEPGETETELPDETETEVPDNSPKEPETGTPPETSEDPGSETEPETETPDETSKEPETPSGTQDDESPHGDESGIDAGGSDDDNSDNPLTGLPDYHYAISAVAALLVLSALLFGKNRRSKKQNCSY